MEDSVAKAGEVANAITDTFENLRFVVAAFGKAIGKRNVKRVQNQLAPVMDCSGTFPKLGELGAFSAVNPVGKQFFGNVRVGRVHKEKEFVFKIISEIIKIISCIVYRRFINIRKL